MTKIRLTYTNSLFAQLCFFYKNENIFQSGIVETNDEEKCPKRQKLDDDTRGSNEDVRSEYEDSTLSANEDTKGDSNQSGKDDPDEDSNGDQNDDSKSDPGEYLFNDDNFGSDDEMAVDIDNFADDLDVLLYTTPDEVRFQPWSLFQ